MYLDEPFYSDADILTAELKVASTERHDAPFENIHGLGVNRAWLRPGVLTPENRQSVLLEAGPLSSRPVLRYEGYDCESTPDGGVRLTFIWGGVVHVRRYPATHKFEIPEW